MVHITWACPPGSMVPEESLQATTSHAVHSKKCAATKQCLSAYILLCGDRALQRVKCVHLSIQDFQGMWGYPTRKPKRAGFRVQC